MITREYLKSQLHYNQETGVFTWAISKGGRMKPGSVAGHVDKTGYRYIVIDGKKYRAHRLAFLYMTGPMPDRCDHINRNPSDNRFVNLRPATHHQNMANTNLRRDNTSGYKGVSWCKVTSKWSVQINIHGKRTRIGFFGCKHHAFCEYVLASRKHFGEFSSV